MPILYPYQQILENYHMNMNSNHDHSELCYLMMLCIIIRLMVIGSIRIDN